MLPAIAAMAIKSSTAYQGGAALMGWLEHVPKKLLDFFDFDMIHRFDFVLRPYRSKDSI